MRAGHDGLFAIVNSWGLDPFNGDLFAFVGKRSDRIKILVWHRGGFLLLYKRFGALAFSDSADAARHTHGGA
jgi:transposase